MAGDGGGELLARRCEAVVRACPIACVVHAARRDIQRKLVGGKEMSRATHRPGLDQGVLLPEGGLNVRASKPIHARPERQLSGGQHLGLNSAGARHGLNEIPAVQMRCEAGCAKRQRCTWLQVNAITAMRCP